MKRFFSFLTFLFFSFLLGISPYVYLPVAALNKPPINWGYPVNLKNFLRLIARADYGSFTLFSGGKLTPDVIFNHIFMLLKDISLSQLGLGIFFSLLAVIFLLRKKDALILAFFVFFLFAGLFFSIFINLPVSSAYPLATSKRFFLLPIIVTSPLFALGLYILFINLGRALKVFLILSSLFILSFAFSFKEVRQTNDDFYENFGFDLLNTLPPNAFLISTGDPYVYSLYYLQYVRGERKDVTNIVWNDLAHEWFYESIEGTKKQEFIPFNDPSKEPYIVRSVVDAVVNKQPVYMVYQDNEPLGFEEKYNLIVNGFLFEIVPKKREVETEVIIKNNRRLFWGYQKPQFKVYPSGSFNLGIVGVYGRAYFNFALFLQKEKIKEAEKFYKTACDLFEKDNPKHPMLALVYRNLGIISLEKKELKEGARFWDKSLKLNSNQENAKEMRKFVAETLKGE